MANNGWNAGVVGPNGHQRNQAAHRDLPGPDSVQDSAFPTGQDQAQQYAGAFSSEMFLGADANFISSEILVMLPTTLLLYFPRCLVDGRNQVLATMFPFLSQRRVLLIMR